MIDLRLMIKIDKKENINKINCSLKDNILFNVITDEYVPIEIVYENYLNTYNKNGEKFLFWNTEFTKFCELLNKFKKYKIIKFNQ